MAQTVAVWLHWYMIGFFVLFGAATIAWRDCFANVGAFIRVRSLGTAQEERLRAAIARREQTEDLPGAAMGITIGVTALAAAAAGALTPVPLVLLYAVIAVVLSATLAAAYVRLRRAGLRRIASLRPRTSGSVIPWWLQTLVVIAAVSPLTFIDAEPVAAVLVTVASVGIALLGERVAKLPALIGDEDPVVDAYVDERLRSVRAVNVLATATAPAYVFEAVTFVLTTVASRNVAALHATAMLVALAGLLAGCAWQFRLMWRKPQGADLERWAEPSV
jgi:hypothetical protein